MENDPRPDGVHETTDPVQPGESTTPVTPSAAPDAAPAEPTPTAPIEEDAERVDGDLQPPNVEINPTEGETGPTVDNQMADPTGLPAQSFEADPSDDKSLPHDQDQA